MRYQTKKPQNTRKHEILPSVSVVIPAYNEEKFVLKCLTNVRKLRYPNDKLEVLIVDDGSTDNTRKLTSDFIKEHSNHLNIKQLIQPRRQGKPLAIKRAREACNGQIVVLTDADTTLRQDAVNKIVRNFADPKVGAVTGKLSIVNFGQSNATKVEKAYRNIFDVLRLGESRLDSTPIFNGPIVALRKELLEGLEADTIADDTTLALETREKGYKAIFDPEAEAYATTPLSYKWRMIQKSRRAMGIIQALIQHRKMIFNPKYHLFGFVILPVEFFMHIISPILLMFFMATFLLIAILNFSALSGLMIILITAAVAFFLLLLASKLLEPYFEMMNPMTFLTIFFEHQLALFLGLLHLLTRGKHATSWEKIVE